MIKVIFTQCFVLWALIGMAQSITPAVLASSGGSGASATNQVDWTVGELAIVTLSDGSNILTQGFHQPQLIMTNTYDDRPDIAMTLFPNPTADVVTINHESELALVYRLHNAAGQTISQKALPQGGIDIPLTNMADGSYFLGVYQDGQLIKTFTIEKTGI